MASVDLECPRCKRRIPADSAYCPYCAYGITRSARGNYLTTGTSLILVATAGSLVFLLFSIDALRNIYSWYPQHVAQSWFIYVQLFTVFLILEFALGATAFGLSLARRKPRVAIALALACSVCGGGVFVVSLITPLTVFMYSILQYFLPLFIAPFIGAMLLYSRREEFRHS